MSQQDTNNAWPILDEDDPPIDFTRENAVYEKERERLLREHLGKIALIREDELVGVFPTADEALHEGYRRFGLVKIMLKEIRGSDLPDYIGHVDIPHPSFRKLD